MLPWQKRVLYRDDSWKIRMKVVDDDVDIIVVYNDVDYDVVEIRRRDVDVKEARR